MVSESVWKLELPPIAVTENGNGIDKAACGAECVSVSILVVDRHVAVMMSFCHLYPNSTGIVKLQVVQAPDLLKELHVDRTRYQVSDY